MKMLFILKRVSRRSFVFQTHLHAKAFCSTAATTTKLIKIGNVSRKCILPKSPELIPIGYFCKDNYNFTRLQWIMKKDLLGQDIFLIGFPGPMRRRLAFQYAELTEREIEYIVLSQDTTESDLKQRREIVSGTAHYKDQSAVLAATEGRILIIDGVEKAERNVLPILNNLLENREVQLEDGRFLISAERYDKLLSENSKDVLDKWKLVRVSEDFRVIALGLPVPQFRGHSLDPPFRSRFQSMDVRQTVDELISTLPILNTKIPISLTRNLINLSHTFLSDESTTLGLQKFPTESLISIVAILEQVPNIPERPLLDFMYPYDLFLSPEGTQYVEGVLKTFNISSKPYPRKYHMSEKQTPNYTPMHSEFDIHMKDKTFKVSLPSYDGPTIESKINFIENNYHNSVLVDMLLTHISHDFCLVGPKGSGKSILLKKFASLLNYPIEMVMLYKDMTARDLLQQRVTNENGDTSWKPSRIVDSALKGKLVVLDGLHRLHQSTLSILQRLIDDRELQLYDGTRLLRYDRYDKIKEKYAYNDTDMLEKKIYRIDPAFRIVALAEPPKSARFKDQWLTAEVLSMFLFHSVRPLSLQEEKHLIEQTVGPLSEKMEEVLNFAQLLRNSKDGSLLSVSNSLSTRQLKRIAHKLALFPHQSIHTLISQTCLTKFLPQLTRQAIEKLFENAHIEKQKQYVSSKTITLNHGKVLIGNTSADVYDPGEDKVKVPNILFYDNNEHIAVMEAMLQDFILGEHLLLIGNQGVGKNKIVDRFLQLLNRPREYIQLHRDTTVQSLTQQSSVIDGRIVYEDSPLVQAVKSGRVLVIDEADKAPTYVTCILKGLVESGEMAIADGRCIIHHNDPRVKTGGSDYITMHPDFRMIVLANRPGFPFLGNDFFATLGDIFSCHAVDNPSMESEIAMLQQYGPSIPISILEKLSKLFGDLRSMSDRGIISYPYSTREAVNIVKHLDKFPTEGLTVALKNVFDFDVYNNELKDILRNIFHKHGIPFGLKTGHVSLAKAHRLPVPQLSHRWDVTEEKKVLPSFTNLKINERYNLPVKTLALDSTEMRCDKFTEQQRFWQLPINEHNVPLDISASKRERGDIIHIVMANPLSVLSLNTYDNTLHHVDLSSLFPHVNRRFKPDVKLTSLGLQFNDSVLLYEGNTNQILVINSLTGSISEIATSNIFTSAKEKLSKMLQPELQHKKLNLCSDLARKNVLVFYGEANNALQVLDLNKLKIMTMEFLDSVKLVSAIDEKTLLLAGNNLKYFMDMSNSMEFAVSKVIEDTILYPSRDYQNFELAAKCEIKSKQLCSAIAADPNTCSTLITNPSDYACFAVNFPKRKSRINILRFPRERMKSKLGNIQTCILPNNSQIAQIVDVSDISKEIASDFEGSSTFLEITNLDTLTYSYVPIPSATAVSHFAQWLIDASVPYFLMCSTEKEDLITVDTSGCIRMWETSQSSLQQSMEDWLRVTGAKGEEEEALTIKQEKVPDVTAPKHGKVDPTGAPHVGGNTWAGGTGGRDTAGLGGKGGPYRLDAGHKVFQLPDTEKDNVPPEVKRAAREMAEKAYKAKLKEIDMSEYEGELYERFSSSVKKQVHVLRTLLDSLQAKGKERQWLKHQTSGELDDTKLIEGITGEKSIYRKRGDQVPEIGAPLEKPKKLRLVVDVSGSMYRFNGHDNRLERELECIVLVMEAFEGYEEKFQYEIIGHSGEEFCIEFVKFNNPPKNNKDRLNILKKMHAHCQFCMSGDNTLRATKHAIEDILKEEADEYFVVVLSDANFDRYAISPKSFGNLLSSNSKVNSFAIFIGTLGDQAIKLHQQLPAGRGFVCFDTQQLPQILQQIFTSSLLQEH